MPSRPRPATFASSSWAQALRAFAYGLVAVVLGATLDERGFSSTEAGVVIAAVVAGTVLASVAVGRWGDRWGRRRCYMALYVALGVAGVVFAVSEDAWLLTAVALTGALSPEVVESGPFTSLEQPMLAGRLAGRSRLRGFGVYNAVAVAAGSLGALAAGGLGPLRELWALAPTHRGAFLVLVPVAMAGTALAGRLSSAVEVDEQAPAPRRPGGAGGSGGHRAPGRSDRTVVRLAGLFALDSFGGGFVVQSFLAYWLTTRFGASVAALGIVFFAAGVLQTASMLAAPLVAERFGLLRTMVFSHLPANLLLVALAFAPSFGLAVALLLLRVTLSQMDVPTRQAYVMALVAPHQRTAAAATTNTARYVVRPVGPALAGAAQSLTLGTPLVIAGAIKSVYDLVLWRWFRTVELPDDTSGPGAARAHGTRRHQPCTTAGGGPDGVVSATNLGQRS